MTTEQADITFSERVLRMREYKEIVALHAFRQHDQHLGNAAEALGITRQTLAKLLRARGIDVIAAEQARKERERKQSFDALSAIMKALDGNVSAAAKALGISRSQLRSRLDSVGINAKAIVAEADES